MKTKLPPKYAVSFRLTKEAVSAISKIKREQKIEHNNDVVELSLLAVAKNNIVLK